MRSVKTISKVTPQNVPPPNKNNYVVKDLQIVHQIKYLIFVNVLLGIDRMYLFRVAKSTAIICKSYSLMLLCFNIYFTFNSAKAGTTHLVIKNLLIVEYVLLVILVLTTVKMKLMNYFVNLHDLDVMLNIQTYLNVTSSCRSNLVPVILCILYSCCEYYLEINIFYDGTLSLSHIYMLIESLAHDIEQIFYFTLIRFTYLRLLIVKAHIARVFNLDDDELKHFKEVEALSERANLDISTLHRVYELLHKCSSELNEVMGVPMLVIFFSSGISTIMLLKLFVNIFQVSSDHKTNATILYLVLRCLKHTLLLIVPCYYSSVTNTQASIIRTILHDAVNTMPLGKSDRRKVKTFFQLTRENDFCYALCGVIKLDMTLPLSYLSLCTTYLVIIIQFSKFID